jgi:hypothetical protein
MDNLPWLCRRREPVGAQAALFEAPMARPPAPGPTW